MERVFNGVPFLLSPQPPTTFFTLSLPLFPFSILSLFSLLCVSSFQPLLLFIITLILIVRSNPNQSSLYPVSDLLFSSSRRSFVVDLEVMMAFKIFFSSWIFFLSSLDLVFPFSNYSSWLSIAMMVLILLSIICSSWQRKVMMGFSISRFGYSIIFLDYSFPPTIYSSRIRKVTRVYKYPFLVSSSNQVRLVVEIAVQHLSFLLLKFRSGYNCGTNIFFFFHCGMAPSPRSVLDPSFQCEAAPICLVLRSSTSVENALRRTLAGRLLTAKRPSIPHLTLAESRLWNCTHRLSCYDHGKCLYSFEFTYAPDVERVVSGGPWYVNGDLLLISRMNPNQSIEQLPFSYAKLWVRCFDLPPMCFTKEYAEVIGNSLGKFCESDLPPDNPDEALLLVQKFPTVRKYLRVKFEFNLYGPLKSTQGIKIYNDEKVVVAEYISRLTYERLPHVCLRCGFLGHLIEGCSFEGPQLYGEWIRAERFFRINVQNSAIPKAIFTSNEGLPPSSSVGKEATQVSNLAELVNNMVNDTNIIRADYSLVRAEGPLPSPKGKTPIIDMPQSSSLVPYSTVSPPKNSTVFGTSGDSILGTVPSFLRSHSSPIGPDSVLIDSDEGQFTSYLNSIAAHEEAYASNANRCLFKMDGPIPVGLSYNKGISSSGSPINSGEASANKNLKAVTQLNEVFKEEIRKLPVRKRPTGNTQTPRPKRGRQSSNSEEPG